MLARDHRLTEGRTIRAVVRGGTKRARRHTVSYIAARQGDAPARFGVIVGKSVGNAVRRNKVRRRIKAVCWELTGSARAHDVVIRALPASARASWDTLHEEIVRSVSKGVNR